VTIFVVIHDGMTRRLQTYKVDEITVTFDPNVCVHSGVCLRGLSAVFDVGRKDWVRPGAAPADEVAAQVERCPSGALQHVRTPRGSEPSDAASGGAH
jgi:uncharacterized Fe-S cluster protein YjdI